MLLRTENNKSGPKKELTELFIRTVKQMTCWGIA